MTRTRRRILLWLGGFITGFGGTELVKVLIGFYD